MVEDCRQDIPDTTLLVRAIRERDINKLTKKIKKAAFIPRRNGKDDDGISVSQPLSDTRSTLCARIQPQEAFFCTLTAGSVRGAVVDDTNLDVCPDPTARDPYHALVKNIPIPRSHDPQSRDIATRFAQLLAQASEEYNPREVS